MLELLVVAFTMIGGILLLNLLIALMASTYERVREMGTKKVNFNRISHTQSVIHQNALLPPPLNIVVVICTAFWIAMDGVVRCCTGGRYRMNIDKISRIEYSLSRKLVDLQSKQEHKHSYSKSHKLLDIHYGDLQRINRQHSVHTVGVSHLEPTYSSTLRSSSSYLSVPISEDTSSHQRSSGLHSDSVHHPQSMTNGNVVDGDGGCFQRSRRPSVCEIGSGSKRTFCKYCRHDMGDRIGSIRSYFDLFRHFRILDDDDTKSMKHLLKNRCSLCSKCTFSR